MQAHRIWTLLFWFMFSSAAAWRAMTCSFSAIPDALPCNLRPLAQARCSASKKQSTQHTAGAGCMRSKVVCGAGQDMSSYVAMAAARGAMCYSKSTARA